MRQLWLLTIVLGCATVSMAQFPPCYRSEFAHEWPIRVTHVDLLDNNRLDRKDKTAMVRELRRQCDCWPCALSDDVSDQIREMYQWYGYFQAVAQVDIKKTGVDSYTVKAYVQEGPQYRLGDISFSGVKAFPAAEMLARAELLRLPDPRINSAKTHGTVRSRYNLWGRLGITDPRFAVLLNSLGELQEKAKYRRSQFVLTPSKAAEYLETLRDMRRHVELRPKRTVSLPSGEFSRLTNVR
jgi:hypothetical protein